MRRSNLMLSNIIVDVIVWWNDHLGDNFYLSFKVKPPKLHFGSHLHRIQFIRRPLMLTHLKIRVLSLFTFLVFLRFCYLSLEFRSQTFQQQCRWHHQFVCVVVRVYGVAINFVLEPPWWPWPGKYISAFQLISVSLTFDLRRFTIGLRSLIHLVVVRYFVPCKSCVILFCRQIRPNYSDLWWWL